MKTKEMITEGNQERERETENRRKERKKNKDMHTKEN